MISDGYVPDDTAWVTFVAAVAGRASRCAVRGSRLRLSLPTPHRDWASGPRSGSFLDRGAQMFDAEEAVDRRRRPHVAVAKALHAMRVDAGAKQQRRCRDGADRGGASASGSLSARARGRAAVRVARARSARSSADPASGERCEPSSAGKTSGPGACSNWCFRIGKSGAAIGMRSPCPPFVVSRALERSTNHSTPVWRQSHPGIDLR